VNIYVIVEGELGAKKLYTSWIPYVNSTLTYAPEIADVVNNHFYIEAAFGWPEYFDRIRNAIANVDFLQRNGTRQFDRLVIVIDSEDMTYAEKEAEVMAEIQPALNAVALAIDYRLVIQHFCLEAWALGNRRLAGGGPNATLAAYRALHNVHTLDPELLPPLPVQELNRAQFAYRYLRLLHNARYHRQTYGKNDPKVVAHKSYFNELVARLSTTGHIGSFNGFLGAFV